ncbi:MAG: hypothetical protein ABW019_10010 [Chitinophagaceae bacterium]
MATFEVFKSFYSEEEAVALCALLSENGIDARIEKTAIIIDKRITGDGVDPDIHLKIAASDFNRANAIIDQHISNNLSQLEPDYYLFAFSDQELLGIIKKPDEWSNQDVIIAKKILAGRGTAVSDEEAERFRADRNRQLSQPEKGLRSWVLAGYFIAVFFSPVGIFFGAYMLNAKKIIPDGNKVFAYDQEIRNHCRIIMIISIILTVAALAGILNNLLNDTLYLRPF